METKTAYKPQMQEEIMQGLMSAPRTIPSKYFYADVGNRLFAGIMRMPEYYFADAETKTLMHHHPAYDLDQQSAKSCLATSAPETVRFGNDHQEIRFKPWDFINTEISQKYDRPMIEKHCTDNHFESLLEITGSRDYFLNAIWQKKNTL